MVFIEITLLFWRLALSGCRVFEDFSALCPGALIWHVPW